MESKIDFHKNAKTENVFVFMGDSDALKHAGGGIVKVYHIVCGRPIGPTWDVYLERPVLKEDPYDTYGTWVEETTIEEVSAAFARHLEYAKEHFPESYFPYQLTVRVRYGDE